MNIPLADAIDKLCEINDILESPHLLIGGLAVERFWPGRDSHDIDLFCTHKLSTTIINKVFPSGEWDSESETGDPRHPKHVFTKKNSESPVKVIFDPRFLEEDPYASIAWNTVKTLASPYPYGSETLENILIPNAGALAFLKLVSYTQRSPDRVDKRNQDLQDVVDLTNYKHFDELHFVACLYSSHLQDLLRNALLDDAEALKVLKTSTRWHVLERILDMGAMKPIDRIPNAETARSSPPNITVAPKKQPDHVGMTQSVAEMLEISTKPRTAQSANTGRDILLVVDVQNDFFSPDALPDGLPTPKLPAKATNTLIAPLNELIRRMERAGAEIVYTRDWHPENHASFRKWQPHCIRDTTGADFHPDLHLAEQRTEVFIGQSDDVEDYSPFATPDNSLHELLSAHDIRTVYVTGIALEFCILATCRDASRYGKTVVALEPFIRAATDDQRELDVAWHLLQSMGVIRAFNFASV